MRRDSGKREQRPAAAGRVYGKQDGASFQVIVLGSSGGPREDTTTGLLVRSTAAEWRKGSVIAVDAGAHLAKIVRILEEEHGLPRYSDSTPPEGYSKLLADGPFAGIECPGMSARANALHIFRELLHSFLITHPHLDHIGAMAINTAALEFGREPKAIVALPPTIDAIKSHIYNDVIWPNLSDEDNGVGFVTYRRLIEGGNPRLGSGSARGYVKVCDGLATKCWSVSHGRCKRRRHHSLRHQRDVGFGLAPTPDGYPFSGRRFSQVSDGYTNAAAAAAAAAAADPFQPPGPKTPGAHAEGAAANEASAHQQAVDSSAFFVRNDSNGDEIIVFGDVEPDSLSLLPRTHTVWEDAAAKVASGKLKAIFIECSYDDSARDQDLYGHLCPRHLIAELTVLAGKVARHRRNQNANPAATAKVDLQDPPSPELAKQKRTAPSAAPPDETRQDQKEKNDQEKEEEKEGKEKKEKKEKKEQKRKRATSDPDTTTTTTTTTIFITPSSNGTTTTASTEPTEPTDPDQDPDPDPPLADLTIHIIHVKDTMADGRPARAELILRQLVRAAEAGRLGCRFHVTCDGGSVWV